MKQALIFGVCGFVGHYLVRELKNHGYEIYGTDVQQNKTSEMCDQFSCCDLMDGEAVELLVKQAQPSCVFNLAAISSVGLSWKIPQKTMDVNVTGGLNILEAVRKHAPDARVLLVGSSEEYQMTGQDIDEKTPLNANNPYGISKIALEQFSEIYRSRYGMRVYHVRSFNHTGAGQKDTFVIPGWCKQAAAISASGKPGTLRVGNISVSRDLSDVRDVVRAYRMVVESEDCSVVYNIGSGRAVKLQEILEFLVSLSDQEICVETDPALMRPADNPRICCDHRLITERLGWEPEYDIFDTVKWVYEDFLNKSDDYS